MAEQKEKLVRKQYHPIFAVKSMGVMIEFTDKRSEAESAYRGASETDKQMYKIDRLGRSTCLERSKF